MLAAHRLDGLNAIGLAQDPNDFFGAVEFVFYEDSSSEKGEKYSHRKRCKSTRSGHY